jgi:polyisoprenoid-binding protein YceI
MHPRAVSLFLFMVLAAPVTYDLDPKQTELIALTQPGGLPGAAHPHVIQASKVTGKVVWDSEAPAVSTVSLSFPTDALINDDPALRRREGMKEMSEGSRQAVGNNLREEDQLSPKLFPTISFESTGIKDLGHGQFEVRGKLSIRGVEKEVSLPANVTLKDGELVGQGALIVKHSDFRFKPYSAALGAVKNLDEIALKVRLVGKARSAFDAGSSP